MRKRGLRFFQSLTFIVFPALLAGFLFPSLSTADPQADLMAYLLKTFPTFSGKVQNIEGNILTIRQSSQESLQPGATLLVAQSQTATVRSVSGRTLMAEIEQAETVHKGDAITGWPRPLPVALVPLSKEALQFLLMHPIPRGDVAAIRTEEVLTAMIENGYGDFSTLEKIDASTLADALKTPLILEVKTLSGLGTNLLQVRPYWEKQKEPLASFSLMLSSGTATSRALSPLAPATQNIVPPNPSEESQELPSMAPPPPTSELLPVVSVPQSPPLPLTMAPESVSPNATPMPTVPALAGFDQPARWIRALELRDKITSMAAGSLTGPNRRELVLSFPGEIRIYSYNARKTRFRERKELDGPDFDTLFRLETYDLNGDGQDEIIADTDQGVLLITERQGNPVIALKKEGIVIRKIGGHLFAQKISDLRAGNPIIHGVSWNGRDWILGPGSTLPQDASLFSLVSLTSSPPLLVGPDHRLSNEEKGSGEGNYGGSNVSERLDIDLPLFARSISVPEGSLLIKNRPEGRLRIGSVDYPTGGQVVLLPTKGAEVLSFPFLGYMSDIALYDIDGDGTGEILASEIVSGLTGRKSYVLIYK